MNLDPVFDSIAEMQMLRVKPGAIIVGKREFDELMGEEYKSSRVPTTDSAFMLVGLPLIFDDFSESRCDVVPEASFKTYRAAFRPGGSRPVKKKEGEEK